MRSFLLTGLIFFAFILSGACALAQQTASDMPGEYASNPCATAPAIDGRQTSGEWEAAAHYIVPMAMTGAEQKTPATIQSEFWLMNSASRVYLAFRVPDDDMQASLQPLLFDLVILQFCRGAALAPGDDKKMVVPGLYADKHFVAPGKDADDKAKHGQGVMNYSGQGEDGAYFVEMELPLDSGDGEDLAAAPGQTVKFNLVYADGFQLDPAKMTIGGLFGPDIENATNWGTMKLADTTTEATPAVGPAWLAAFFPYTGAPDEFQNRLQRTESAALDVDGKQGGQVTCQFIYPEIDGNILTGTVKFFLPPVLAEEPGKRVPLLHVAGYETDANGVMGFLKEGIAVSTVHGHALNPLARGPKLEWALLHAERRLPFVDDAQVFIHGGSAGGYMTLMTTSETFPVVCAIPLVPPVNWAYNASYIAKSKTMAFSHREGSEEPWLSFVAPVTGITDQAQALFGADTEAPVYFNLSPVSLIDSITAPVLTAFTTADMLVPIDQVSADFIRPFDPAEFPEGFTQDMAALLGKPEQHVRLLDVLPEDSREVFMASAPEGAGKLKADGSIDGEGKSMTLPFSRDRQWSIVIIDEGAPEPQVGHFKYAFGMDFNEYWQWALGEGVRADQLTPGKLERLMKRYLGIQPMDFMVTPAEGKAYKAQLLDFPQAERADVLRGLITFARDEAAASHLAEVYSSLPGELKALGATLGDGSPSSVRQSLEKASAALEN